MSTETRIYKQKDLILRVYKHFDSTKINLDEWDTFINRLCGDREYQKEAIRSSLLFLATKRYKSTEELVIENFERNLEIKSKFVSTEQYISLLQLPGKLSANIDLATGTGKSYVMYGVAQIMLGLGLVEKVLVLCPSTTIESGLKEKFLQLSGNADLTNTLPIGSKYPNPRIISANETIRNGDICIENIHAVYSNTGSSIDDSLRNKQESILVLNDESHHIYNKHNGKTVEEKNFKKWKEFLLSSEFMFNYILGFTGTAYIDDEYFNDVIYRFSLKEAIEQKFVKNIDYVKEDDSANEEERFQKIYQNHCANKVKYPLVKPLTILITKDVAKAKQLMEKLTVYLAKQENTSLDETKNKVLIVTSSHEHKANVMRLKYVDDTTNQIQWIVSVSMLNEGWDVKNVFQIVPWEDRAFNSKLLVAQVLGRGLRIPNEYIFPQPKVIVFNHKSWSSKIKKLVDEILEIESRIFSEVLMEGNRSIYHFDVHSLNYEKKSHEVQNMSSTKNFDYSRLLTEGIDLESQTIFVERETVFTTAVGNAGSNDRPQSYTIENNSYLIDEVIDQLFDAFENMEWEGATLQLGTSQYTQNNLPKRSEIRTIIDLSMQKRGNQGDRVIEKNRVRILNAFNTLLRKGSKTIVFTSTPSELITKNTNSLMKQSSSISNFKSGENTLFHSSDWIHDICENEQIDLINEMLEDESYPKKSSKEVNEFYFKTPVTTVIATSDPELKFIQYLCKKEISELINAWVKSRDRGFYEIEYSIRLGSGNSKTRKYTQRTFNPDFFIQTESEGKVTILVVETKSDDDCSDENKAKYQAALEHFENLNSKLEEKGICIKYIFHFISPNSYSTFFDHFKNGSLLISQDSFRSELESKLIE